MARVNPAVEDHNRGLKRALELIEIEASARAGFLDLGQLELAEIPEQVFTLTQLKALNLGEWYRNDRGQYERSGNSFGSNLIKDLPSQLALLTQMTRLCVSGCEFFEGRSYPILPTLQSLDCSRTGVSDLTPLQGLSSLQSLNCSRTGVSDLTSLQSLSSLQSLFCSGTGVSDLTPLRGLSSLQSLLCSGTGVSDLTPLRGLSSLQSLDCSGTGVSDLTSLQGLSSLQSLDCSRTGVSDLTSLQSLSSLQSLNCSRTGVSDLTSLQSLSSLQSLFCSGTGVSDLTPLRGLSSLQSLLCSGTGVSDLTPLRGLSSLQSLFCSGTGVSDLTPLRGLSSLQSLDCSGTGVSDLTPLRGLSSLQSLDCSGTGVSDLTPLRGLSSLQSLDCSGTGVSDLTSLQGLSSLQSLNCSRTGVSDLTSLQSLSSLQSLFCSGTGVSDLTPLRGLSSLQSLLCSGTGVSDLTPLRGLSSLQSLDCSGTGVSDLTSLQGLSSLQSLLCSKTAVVDLTPLQGLASFRLLDCCGNQLEKLPEKLIFSDSMRFLWLWESKVPDTPLEAMSASESDDCLHKLRAHITDLKAGKEIVRTSKVIVLGNGRVGKTQLCRAIQNLPYDETEPTTHGINIISVPWPDAGEKERICLWDFGGQDIYHGTHALFLKTKAVFVLAWHPEFEFGTGVELGGVPFQNQPLSYWLEYIRTLGAEREPVIVVQTRCDRPEMEKRTIPPVDKQFFKICHFSAKQKRGVATLREGITDAVKYIRDTDGFSVIGAGRMKVLARLEKWREADQLLPSEKREHRTLTMTEFESLCTEAGNISSPEMFLRYLHDMGAVFFRKELFEGKIILDQTWALEAVYSVFNREKSSRQIMSLSGKFTRSLLDLAVWNGYSPEEQKLFISLMESCGICFLYRKENKRLDLEAEYIAPDLLPDRAGISHEMQGRWNENGPAKQLVIEYPFLHVGLMRSLICDIGRHAGDAGVYWKYGAWVYERASGARMLIKQEMIDTCRGRIIAELQGERNGELGIWLRDRIVERSRLFGYPEIKPEKDEFPTATNKIKQADESSRLQIETKIEVAVLEPRFEKMPASAFPTRDPEMFVSYAWGDATPEGEARRKLVDDLCVAMKKAGMDIKRDSNEMATGDRISEFMDRLVEGDFIICIISDKYLHSPYCMYELFHIYRGCGDKPERFLKKVIPLILPDSNVNGLTERLKCAAFWKKQRTELEAQIKEFGLDVVGKEAMKKYYNIKEFSHNVSDILELLVDKLMPRDFDRMAGEGFKEVLKLVKNKSK